MTQPSRAKINELADKWLKGTLTPSEKELLDEWYDLDTSEPINWTSDCTEEQLRKRLLQAIQNKKKSPFKRMWQIPAAAVFLITLGISSYFYFSELNSSEQIVVLNDINPGRNKAILTLGNGQKINLTDVVNGHQISNQSGIKITKTADGKLVYDASSILDNDKTIEYNTVEAPIGGQWQVKLPDGSLVYLNASSSITYPTKFLGNKRNVKMTGEAYFEIFKDRSHPFIVSTATQEVEVLGTHFNINSYTDEPTTTTTLLEGSVKISKGVIHRILKPNQQSLLTAGNFRVETVDAEDVVAWKDGLFIFNDEPLENIMRRIERWYDVKVEYDRSVDKKRRYGGSVSRYDNVSSVIDVLESTKNIHFKIEGRRIVVMK